jgi:hypothetical protein
MSAYATQKKAGLSARLLHPCGGVAEWLKAADFKSVGGLPFPRGFKSRPLRTVAPRAGRPAVGLYHIVLGPGQNFVTDATTA